MQQFYNRPLFSSSRSVRHSFLPLAVRHTPLIWLPQAFPTLFSFRVDKHGLQVEKEECIHHWGRLFHKRGNRGQYSTREEIEACVPKERKQRLVFHKRRNKSMVPHKGRNKSLVFHKRINKSLVFHKRINNSVPQERFNKQFGVSQDKK